MRKSFLKVTSLKYIAAFLIPAVFVMFMNLGIDNDSWFVLAEGRYLVENGVHYTDVLTMHQGLNLVVQNYGFAAIFYLVYSAFGVVGLYVMMLILNFVICYLIYKICMIISHKNVNLSLFIMMITDFLLTLGGFTTTRAQMVSYVLLLALIYVLELFISTNKAKYLCWVPVISLLQINLHGSVWWILMIVLMVYIIDAIRKPKLYLQGYRMKPLILVTIVAFFAGLINPYGLKMIAYIFTSYGSPVIARNVIEMRSFNMMGIFNVFLYGAIVLTLVMYIFGEKKKIRVRYLLLFFGFLALGLNSIKGMSQLILVMLFPLALLYDNIRIENIFEAKIARESMVFWIGITTIGVFVAQCVMFLPMIKNSPYDSLVQAVDVIEQLSGGDKNINVYVGYNDGGYVEYRGYKAYLDPRAEVFLKNNNGKEDILVEWEKMLANEVELSEFLEKYDFDYLIAEESHEKEMYRLERDDYKLVYANEDDGIKVFKKND